MQTQFMRFIILVCFAACTTISHAAATVVFTNDFDGALPPEITPGLATLTNVQGYAGLGPVGNQFGGKFLRSPTGTNVTLTLSNLPPHNALHISMLFAAIDSLDGTGTYPAGDFFRVTVGTNEFDTNVVFRESFANATPDQIQSYVAPTNGVLARRVDLGFSGPGSYYTDSAYDFGVDSRFRNLAHTGPVAVLSFLMEGPGVQSLDDESWAMENFAVLVTTLPVIQDIHVAGTNISLTWSADSNLVYQVQSKTNLLDATWSDLVPQVSATNSTATFVEPIGPGNKFYRVKLVSP